ncbi:patatin-like phospholipase family protein [Veronia pacifica]|uniref:Serine protease n=1 Tax=Veronia pacifica TaxID=1080227 RepID=A0A1C3EIU8_9GAMM|nr:patatin-like phospholipase family protein [Veronia pacifica]ODA33153.1 serine protease [Veronia pacifica]
MIFTSSLGRIITAAIMLSAVFVSSLASANENLSRPKIGLALGGGGAKGAAHVGVLKALEEMHIPVDYIAGTSMGAYVGGLYASGMSADDIHVLLESIEWKKGYQDREKRGKRRVRTKASDDRFNIQANIGYEGTEIKTPQGIVQGQYMKRILRESTGSLPAFSSFDNLVLPFRAVATDIEKLTPVVIDKGVLSKAMLASMSVPGALPAVELDGHLLVDGGPVNNMPVDVLKEMGADIIIAVDIGTDYVKADKLKSFYQVSNQLINFMVRNSTEAQIAKMSKDDILLRPDVGDMHTADFYRMPEALQKGYQAAHLAESSLSNLIVSSADYQAYVERKQKRRKQLEYADQIEVAKVVIDNQTPLSDQVLMDRLKISTGKIDTHELEKSIENLNALDRFESIGYEVHQVDGENELHLEARERSWGPSFLDFRFAIEDDFNTNTLYSAGVRITNTGLSEYGAELVTQLELGNDKVARVELDAPLTASQEFHSIIWGQYSVNQFARYRQSDDEPIIDRDNDIAETADYSEWEMGTELTWQPELWSEFTVGYQYLLGDEKRLGGKNNKNFLRKRPYLRMTLDTLDNRVFPAEGSYLSLTHSWLHDEIRFYENSDQGTLDARQLELEALHAESYGKHTLYGRVSYSRTSAIVEDISGFAYQPRSLLIEPKGLGGLFNLSGFPRQRLLGNNLAFASAIYRYRLQDNDFGLFKTPVYIGASLERGAVWNNPDFSIKDIPFYNAGSIFAGVDTMIGPVVVAYGYAETGDDSFYLSLGTQF